MRAAPRDHIDYPYGAKPLLPGWHSLKGRTLAAMALACAGLASYRANMAGLPINDVALLTMLPGMLAVTLGFAPEPRTRLGTMAKDLLCLATGLAPLAHQVMHYLILGVPLLLACAVAMDRMLPPGLRVPARFRTQATAA
jgi:hypothetical protein